MPVATDLCVRFGPFKFDSRTGRLEKHGYRIKLQPRSATVLGCLIENSASIVTREQLQSRLWPNGTYVDFDLGIKVAVRRLRDALGDSADEPIYIQTIRAEGYRFIGQIERPVTSDKPSLVALEPEEAAGSSAESGRPANVTLWIPIAMVVLLLIAAVTVPRLHRPAVGFQSGDWLLIGDFENKTGDQSFDGSIEYGFEREIGQSRYVNVVSRARVDDTLQLMRQKKGTPLDENLARQVALRDTGIRAVVLGRIERFDANYVLTARLIEPASGKIIAVFEQSETKPEIPRAIRRIADSLRPRLGESEPQKREVLQLATTASIKALQAFSSGMRALDDDKLQEAAALFEGATELDPQFAMAHVFAGYAYEDGLGNEDKARPHYKAAFDLADGTSERERLFIRASYFARFERDPVRATPEFLSLVNLYPDDLWGVKLLLWNSTPGNPVLLHSTGMRPADRVELLERVVRVRPTSPDSLIELMYLTRYALNDRVRSEKYRQRLNELRASGGAAPANWIELDLLPVLEAWRGGDIATADRELPRLTERALAQDSIRMKFDVAMSNLAIGHLSDAQRVCTTLPPLTDNTTNMNQENCSMTVAYLRGDRAAMAQEERKILKATPAQDIYGINGIGVNMMLHAGMVHEADTLLARRAPSHIEPILRGLSFVVHGQPSEAMEALRLDYTPLGRALTTRGNYFWTREAMARALVQLGSLDEAIRILRETDPGDVRYMSAAPWPVPRLLLIRLLRQAGRNTEADSVEAELRRYMAYAEKDHIVFKVLQSQSQMQPAMPHNDGRDGARPDISYEKAPH